MVSDCEDNNEDSGGRRSCSSDKLNVFTARFLHASYKPGLLPFKAELCSSDGGEVWSGSEAVIDGGLQSELRPEVSGHL